MNANSSATNKTIAEWLFETMKRLGETGVDSPRRDALVLLEDTIAKDRAWVLAHPEYELEPHEIAAVQKLVQQRLDRVPLAYIRGKAWFFGRFFAVHEHVLIPRPESESFIELLHDLKPTKVIDIGTGSGALAITTKLELPETEVIATDLSTEALAVATKNAQAHVTDITFLLGSLLEPVTDVQLAESTIITNLPYVPNRTEKSPELATEPPEALFSGDDGLDHYREFWKQVNQRSSKPTYILTESLESQHPTLIKLAKSADYKYLRTDILVQVFTVDQT
jgi:release factor glutamine methyltransferase